MSWRVVVVSSRAKLELKLNYLVIRNNAEIKKIHIDEISVLIIENTGSSVTASLLESLWKKKIAVIFCDAKRNPGAQLIPYYGSFDTSQKVLLQTKWTDHAKQNIWAEIIKEKIRKQAGCLWNHDNAAATKLLSYVPDVNLGDETNREGHAAKVYFTALFGPSFSRSEVNYINAALNYGYSIILSAVAREITANGYITQLGIFHHNTFNQFNLACDIMEPFRPLIDQKVIHLPLGEDELEKEEKLMIIQVLNEDVIIAEKHTTVLNAITIYVRSVFDALESDDVSQIKFYSYEF